MLPCSGRGEQGVVAWVLQEVELLLIGHGREGDSERTEIYVGRRKRLKNEDNVSSERMSSNDISKRAHQRETPEWLRAGKLERK